MSLNVVFLALTGVLLCHFTFADDGRDAADRRFLKCCADKNLPCRSDCWYHDAKPSWPAGKSVTFGQLDCDCLNSKYFEDYIHCAAGPTDNRDCCKTAGVATRLCLELCDGTNPLSNKDPVTFFGCASVRKLIAKCLHDANNHANT